MSQERFADVILPLALDGELTYSVPADWTEEQLQPGTHVIVSLGKRKQLSGIISKVHTDKPEVDNIKPLEHHLGMALSDETQLKFWKWITMYYMCLPGEVMAAALPSRLKISSETVVSLSEKAKRQYQSADNELEQRILGRLQNDQHLKLNDLQKTHGSAITPILKSLVDRDLILLRESIYEPEPQFFTDVLSLNPEGALALKELLDGKRAPVQQKAMGILYPLLEKHGDLDLKSVQKITGLQRDVIKKLVDKDILHIETVERSARVRSDKQRPLHLLSSAQQLAYATIKEGFKRKKVQFLHGVTSSGKTEIYAHLMQENLREDKQVLFLLPEIALTTQLINRIAQFFGDSVAVYHSRMSEKERSDVWESVRKNQPGARIVIGARSSIFLPFSNLGLIVVDEEHDQSYKQTDPAPRYQGRDCAVVLGHLHQADVLLGSATPSMETWSNCLEGRYDRIPLTERYQGIEMPAIELVDIGWEKKKRRMHEDFSEYLLESIRQELAKDKQVIVFHNRRGYTPFTECKDCGESPMCINCDITLTYHKHSNKMRCHLCGYRESPQGACKSCGSTDLRMAGAGTEKIVDQLENHFPDINIDRLDWDNTRKRNAFANVIERFESGDTRILVGTQMITKGLDFKKVGLVAIVNADVMSNMPDIRAQERSYQLAMQVAGRAGRFGERGRVVIQTYKPKGSVLQCVAKGRQEDFYREEMKERRDFAYPPYTRLVRLCLRHSDAQKVYGAGYALKAIIEKEPHVQLLGPEPPLVARAKNQYRIDFLIKYRKDGNYQTLKNRLHILVRHFFKRKEHQAVRFYFDVDP